MSVASCPPMRAEIFPREPSELRHLRQLSARLGSNPLLVQASTGNTSLKLDGVLWIKASGKWFIHADQHDFLVPVDLASARSGNGAIAPLYGDRCASIETAMHAVLPHPVVIHVHSVNAIAWAVRKDATHQLQTLLSGLHWQWIPYEPSGLPLARTIEWTVSRSPETNVLILGNHGLVVCAHCCGAAEDLLAQVESRLALPLRPAPPRQSRPSFPAPKNSDWSLSESPQVNALATDASSRKILAGGVLYPCQAIFLPGTTPALRTQSQTKQQPFVLIEEHGVSLSRGATRAELAILNGLAEVVQRIDPSAPLRYLDHAEVSAVLSGGASSYRQIADPDFR